MEETIVLAYPLILVFAAAMIYAAISDLLTMTIPNKVSILLIAIFPLAALAAGLSWPEFFSHLGAGAIVLTAGFAMFAAGIFGGGDAKLLAAGALWIGLEQLLPFIYLVAIFGGILAIVILAYRRFPAAIAAGQQWSIRLHDKSGGIPYGIAIAAAAFVAFTKTGLYSQLLG